MDNLDYFLNTVCLIGLYNPITYGTKYEKILFRRNAERITF